MKPTKTKKGIRRFREKVLILLMLACIGFAIISTYQLNQTIDLGNRKIVLNYTSQVAARIHDLFERVDVSLANLSNELIYIGTTKPDTLHLELDYYKDAWNLDVIGTLYEGKTGYLSDETKVEFENEIFLQDVLTFSQKLNITRQRVGGQDMLIFAKPCEFSVDGKKAIGIFAGMRVEQLERLLGDYGYSNDSFMVITQENGNNIWKQNDAQPEELDNCFEELEEYPIGKGDSILQMQTRMKVALDGTLVYDRNGQNYYMAYVPLNVNYWYLLVSTRSDAIDLTELARQHYIISSILMIATIATGVASVLYLIQRNRSITKYNKQLEVAAAMESQANKAKQESKARQDFFAKVSHDIRTPLNGVIGMLTLAEEEITDEEKCREYLNKAFVSAKYLMGLLNDVLDMSQIESGKQKLTDEIIDVEEMLKEIEEILETSTKDKNLSVKVDAAALQHRYFRGDTLRLKQILMNLCTNAIKYTGAGGYIILEAGEDAEAPDNHLYFKVTDNGEGIPEDRLESIFNPFEQVSLQRQGGVGLGLSIVRSFVELMGGKISVESQVGIGSTFTVELPLQVTGAPLTELANEKAADLKNISLLLAEDNEINAMIIISLLEKRGVHVTHATDGEIAVEEFRRAPAGTYQIILMDIQMPNMDGLEATRRIRAMKDHSDAATIPILSMTANAFNEQKEEMLKAGMNDFLYKPIEIDEVCRRIEKWVVKSEA